MIAGDIEVVLQLLGSELIGACLDLDQGSPALGATRDPDEAIGVQASFAQNERHLDEALDGSAGRTEGLHETSSELFDGRQHRQES